MRLAVGGSSAWPDCSLMGSQGFHDPMIEITVVLVTSMLCFHLRAFLSCFRGSRISCLGHSDGRSWKDSNQS